jgi:hypothetical protein
MNETVTRRAVLAVAAISIAAGVVLNLEHGTRWPLYGLFAALWATAAWRCWRSRGVVERASQPLRWRRLAPSAALLFVLSALVLVVLNRPPARVSVLSDQINVVHRTLPDMALATVSPAHLATFNVEHRQYRPLKFALIWVAGRTHTFRFAMLFAHAITALLVLILIDLWTGDLVVATIVGVGFLLHPVGLYVLVFNWDIQYLWAAPCFLLSMIAVDRHRDGAAVLAYLAACFFQESWVPALLLLLWMMRSEPRRMIPFVLAAAFAASVLLYANLRYAQRVGMVTTLNWRRALINVVFEPYWGFYVPWPFPYRSAVLFAALGSAMVPLRIIWAESRVVALWVMVPLAIAPALMFFELTPDWSHARLAYGTCALLAVATGVMFTHRRTWTAIAVFGWLALTWFYQAIELSQP